MNRAERRRMLREAGFDGTWKRGKSPAEVGYGNGWCRELDRAYTNGEYAVMVRTVQTPWGAVEHACIRNTDNTDIPWREKQKIKNDLFGRERVAVEIFPAESELVDDANMYHLWILPDGFKLPFGLPKETN